MSLFDWISLDPIGCAVIATIEMVDHIPSPITSLLSL